MTMSFHAAASDQQWALPALLELSDSVDRKQPAFVWIPSGNFGEQYAIGEPSSERAYHLCTRRLEAFLA